MESLVKDGQVVRGWIGVEPRDLTPEIADSFGLPVKEGVLITGVLADGPASRGGLKPGDVVVRIAGKPVANTAQLMSAVALLRPDSGAVIGVQRGGATLEIKLVVAKRPSAKARR